MKIEDIERLTKSKKARNILLKANMTPVAKTIYYLKIAILILAILFVCFGSLVVVDYFSYDRVVGTVSSYTVEDGKYTHKYYLTIDGSPESVTSSISLDKGYSTNTTIKLFVKDTSKGLVVYEKYTTNTALLVCIVTVSILWLSSSIVELYLKNKYSNHKQN